MAEDIITRRTGNKALTNKKRSRKSFLNRTERRIISRDCYKAYKHPSEHEAVENPNTAKKLTISKMPKYLN